VAIFVGIIFHLLTFLAFDMPMSEGLFVVLVLALLAAFVWTIAGRSSLGRLAAAASVGLCAALLIEERGNDAVLVYAMVAACAAAALMVAIVRLPWRLALPQSAGAIVLMVGAAVGGVTLSHGANYLAWGYFGQNETLSKGQQHLLGSLMSIDTGEPPIHKWVPITNRALEIAYGLSPTLASFRDKIEGPFRKTSEGNALGGASRTGIKGPIRYQ
jgi:hypothetical protein